MKEQDFIKRWQRVIVAGGLLLGLLGGPVGFLVAVIILWYLGGFEDLT